MPLLPNSKSKVNAECAFRPFNWFERLGGNGKINLLRYKIRVFWSAKIVKRAIIATTEEKNSKPFASYCSIGVMHSIEDNKLSSFMATFLKGQNHADPVKILRDSTHYYIYPHSGNTDLHETPNKTSLLDLLEPKEEELRRTPIDATNFAGQTALHTQVLVGDIGCVMALVAYDINLDTQDHNGDTALHIVASVCCHLISTM